MRVAGLPLWAIVLVACVVAPWLIRLFLDTEQRRAKRKTTEVLQGFAGSHKPARESAAGAVRAASDDS
ncbi:MAG: hypothetical protein ACXWUG_04610 [Polyangiales bacterium]